MNPRLHSQSHPVLIFELLGRFGQKTHELLASRTNPSLQITAHGYFACETYRPGFAHPTELGSGTSGQGVHAGESTGPHTLMSEYCVDEQKLSYWHGVHCPRSMNQPAAPFHGLHCVLHDGSWQRAGCVLAALYIQWCAPSKETLRKLRKEKAC